MVLDVSCGYWDVRLTFEDDVGSPGADRVVINGQCSIAGIITHTGASGNAFVACAGTS